MNSVDTNVDVKMEDVKVEVINQILKDEAKNNDIKSIYKAITTFSIKNAITYIYNIPCVPSQQKTK